MIVQSMLLGLLALASAATAQDDLPQLTLPWGKYEATKWAADEKILLFKNVRFAAEPERFSAPAFPDWLDDSVQKNDKNIACLQVDTKLLRHPPGGKNPLDAPDEEELEQTEDCLFLDVFAPADAFKPGAEPLPVIVWIYGGAYAIGSKGQGDVLYTGQSMLKASDYKVIYVVGNYRVGAFGWLAGNYMEQAGTPNAGLYDQALLLQWVQDHIHKVGGDKDRVTAWGLSAGAGSIMHHLIREDGEVDPLFHSFVAWSPGYEWAWDNSADGKLDTVYRIFSRLANCSFEYDIQCLRDADKDVLAGANQELFDNMRDIGFFPVGPSIDGKWIKTLAPLALSQGKYWNAIDNAILSHAANESGPFVPEDIIDQASFDGILELFLPGPSYESLRTAIRDQYNCVAEYESDFQVCIGAVIQHLIFTCNTRYLFNAFPTKTYAMQYGFPSDALAMHGVDLVPLFTNNFQEAKTFLLKAGLTEDQANLYATSLLATVSPAYKKFFAGFAVSGDPNTLINVPPIKWNKANGDGDALTGVVKVKQGLTPFQAFEHISDGMNTQSDCGFWEDIARVIVDQSGGQQRKDEL